MSLFTLCNMIGKTERRDPNKDERENVSEARKQSQIEARSYSPLPSAKTTDTCTKEKGCNKSKSNNI